MNTSLDVSNKIDQISIDLLIAVDATARALGVAYCIVGAFARDVVLGLCYGIKTGEATRDIDFGLMMDSWAQFDAFRSRLLEHNGFTGHPSIQHRLRFRGARDLDIVPFGAIEQRPGEIAWPPEFATMMSTVGFREAQAKSVKITVADGISVPFVSPAALALLKLIAWSDRGSAVNRKDARDLALLLATYLQAGNEERLYGEHADLLDEDAFDLDSAGARILGRDLASMTDRAVRERVEAIVRDGLAESRGEPLLRALPLQSDKARRLLESLQGGLSEGILVSKSALNARS